MFINSGNIIAENFTLSKKRFFFYFLFLFIKNCFRKRNKTETFHLLYLTTPFQPFFHQPLRSDLNTTI